MHPISKGHITCGRNLLLQVHISGQPVLVFGHRPVARVTRVVCQHGAGELNLRVRLLHSEQSHSPISVTSHPRTVQSRQPHVGCDFACQGREGREPRMAASSTPPVPPSHGTSASFDDITLVKASPFPARFSSPLDAFSPKFLPLPTPFGVGAMGWGYIRFYLLIGRSFKSTQELAHHTMKGKIPRDVRNGGKSAHAPSDDLPEA